MLRNGLIVVEPKICLSNFRKKFTKLYLIFWQNTGRKYKIRQVAKTLSFCKIVEIFFLDLRFILGVVWGFILFSGDSFIEWRFMLCIEEIYYMYSPGIYFGRVA